MKIKFLKLKSWLLVTVMGALGLSSCHCHKQLAEPEESTPSMNEREEMKLMYGVPTMYYQIRGQVRDAEGNPVKNIRVNMLERGMEVQGTELQGDPERVKEWLEESAAITDKEGRYELTDRGTPIEQVRLMVRDVDGKKNGEFKDQLVEVEVKAEEVDRTGAQGWYQGTVNKQIDIKLENK